MTNGSTGISDLVKRMKLGQEKPKPSIDLLVAIQQDCDVSRHNLHVLASPKHQEIEGKLQGQNQAHKALEINQNPKQGGGRVRDSDLGRNQPNKSLDYSQESDYKSHNSAYHPIILPAKWILD